MHHTPIGCYRDQVKIKTINYGLKIVCRICNLAVTEWIDEYGLTWLVNVPKIKLLPEHDLHKPYQLFSELPEHSGQMALFAVNTGCRKRKVCQLQWDWEIKIPVLEELQRIILQLNCKIFMKRRIRFAKNSKAGWYSLCFATQKTGERKKQYKVVR